jgi:cytochrome c5
MMQKSAFWYAAAPLMIALSPVSFVEAHSSVSQPATKVVTNVADHASWSDLFSAQYWYKHMVSFTASRFRESASLDAALWSFESVARPMAVDQSTQTTHSTKAKSPKQSKPRRYTMLDGRDVFMQHCMSCHLAEGNSAPQLAHQADWSWRVKAGVDFLVDGVIQGPEINDVLRVQAREAGPDRYRVDTLDTVPATSDVQRPRGCAVKRGGCKACTDAEIIAVVKYMVQSAATDNANYSLW